MSALTGKTATSIVLGDIGGTNARFAYVTPADASIQCIHTYACSEYGRFEDALHAYIQRLANDGAPKSVRVCLAVAASVHEDRIRMTNSPWQFSRSELSAQLGMPVQILNDFSAQAHCLSALGDEQLQWWQQPANTAEIGGRYARTVVGPGTGFGGATLLPSGEILESEPGHVSFAPVNAHEAALLTQLWQRYPRISVEHLLSGPGLANLYWANAALNGAVSELPAPAIVAGAQAGEALCLQSIRDFTAIMGSVCGDIALSTGSLSGLYLSGAMLAKMDTLFDQGLFMRRFTDKGPFSEWCSNVPVARISAAYPGLLGCAVYSRKNND